VKCGRYFGKRATVIVLFASLSIQGCSQTNGEAPPIASLETMETSTPIILASSADLGCLRSESGSASRIVRLRNSSNTVAHVSRWTVSCDCLTVEPASLKVEPAKSTYIQLLYDPTKEGQGFVGDLRMAVEGFADSKCVCTFDVLVSVIPSDDVKHLDGLRD
jgi:hypothetical protein